VSTIPPEISIIVPTFNARANVIDLTNRVRQCLGSVAWEIIYVDDDSPDETAALVRDLGLMDRRIRCIQRVGRRGLSSACIEGMLSSSALYVAVIDGDAQHDERLLPQMLAELKTGELDIVIGSRARPGPIRARLNGALLPDGLTDPSSGFFMLRRCAFNGAFRKLSAPGSKILAELLASCEPPPRCKEMMSEIPPLHPAGSKSGSLTVWDYAMLLVDKSIGRIVPARFVAFSFVGAMGVAVHLAVLTLLLRYAKIAFVESQAVATLVTMSFNYVLNNRLTYADQRLRGLQWLRGWLSFNLACSIGGCMNVGLATYLWQLSGASYLAAMAGIAAGAVWNYAVTKTFTWNHPNP